MGRVRRVRFGSAISEHPGLAVVFVTPAHGGALEDVVNAVDEILRPDVLLGAVARSVVGPGREVERGAGISLWAGSIPSVRGLSLQAVNSNGGSESDDRPDATRITGWPA